MDNVKNDIEAFIQRLNSQIRLLAIQAQPFYFVVQTERMTIFLYYPEIPRVEDDLNSPSIHIDYDQLCSAELKIINRLRGLQGLGGRIYARQTKVARIDKRMALEFLEEHHLQGALPGKYRYGLFYQGDLVSVAIFGGARLMRMEGPGYRSFELIRFCHKADLLVVGGLSKLIRAFCKEFNPQDIMTYADRDWSQDKSSLSAIGFEIVAHLPAQKFAIIDGKRLHHVPEGRIADYFIENKGSLKLKLVL